MYDLLRRLPPPKIDENVDLMCNLLPSEEEQDEFLGGVDRPLQLRTCSKTGKDYLICDYNRDGESYRSPWSNEYEPPFEEGAIPSPKLRKLEQAANEAFDTYREMYFEGGVSSAYLWDAEDGAIAGAILFKKTLNASSSSEPSGTWDSIHVFEAFERGRTAHYKLTSTVMLQLVSTQKEVPKENVPGEWTTKGNVNLSGSMTRQVEQDYSISEYASHISNTGRMIEDMEIKMRNLLQDVYFGKTRDIVYDLRSLESLERARRQRELQKELVGFMKKPSNSA